MSVLLYYRHCMCKEKIILLALRHFFILTTGPHGTVSSMYDCMYTLPVILGDSEIGYSCLEGYRLVNLNLSTRKH